MLKNDYILNWKLTFRITRPFKQQIFIKSFKIQKEIIVSKLFSLDSLPCRKIPYPRREKGHPPLGHFCQSQEINYCIVNITPIDIYGYSQRGGESSCWNFGRLGLLNDLLFKAPVVKRLNVTEEQDFIEHWKYKCKH